jgi:predicted nucleic acid-binding protein
LNNSIVENDIAVISTQVLQEFYNICTIELHLIPLKVKGYLHNYSENFEVVQNGCEVIERGIDISIISQISFWDALILAAAEYSKCSVVVTEDLNDGQIINGIKTMNPFIAKHCTSGLIPRSLALKLTHRFPSFLKIMV